LVKFVGRDRLLEQLHTQLQIKDRIAITAIARMGGISTTELALQYAIKQLQQGQYPAGICWLRARDREIAIDIVTFAQFHLGLSLPDQLEINEQVRFCWQWWPEGEALVILDDVIDYQAITPYLPSVDSRFKLLITTRVDLGTTVQNLEKLDEDGVIAVMRMPEDMTLVERLEGCNNESVEDLEEPEEVVGINSPFYIERPPREARCYQAISRRGALVRIKAPGQMGKSSLMIRVLDQANQLGYKAVRLNFQSADESSFTDLDCFLRWFCASIGQELELPENIDAYWQSKIFDSKRKCINFFRSFVLKEIQCPVVLALDDVDRIFHFPEIYHDFFGLLRSWHESAKIEKIWENLRLIVVHSQEAYIPLDILQSPFNVGTGIELVAFDKAQVEVLAAKHQLRLSYTELNKLMTMFGGHPYLTRVALYALTGNDVSLNQLLQTAPTQSGLFTEHLRRHLNHLRTHPELLAAMRQVVMADYPVRLSDDLYQMSRVLRVATD
jgi:AAA-like domain/NB-ARC domain